MNKEELYQYFIKENHTLQECGDFFGFSRNQIRKILCKYGIKKEQEVKIDYELLYNFYIVENHTLSETMKHFNVSKTCLCSKLKKFNILKDKDKVKENIKSNLKKVIIDKDVLFKYYIIENLTLEETSKKINCSKKSIIRRLKEYGIKKNSVQRYENSLNGCKRKYGVEHPSQLQEFKDKVSKTNQEKYGVPYACMRRECRTYSSNNSKPNLYFENLLKEKNIEFEREFSIGIYSYDFKVGNYLFEINPFAFHNSTFSPVGKPKEKTYHYNKSKVARENGFRCINIWDWDDIDKIVLLFLGKKNCIYARNCSVRSVTKEDAISFINENHLQGYAKDEIRLGLFDKKTNELLSIMTFGKPRYNSKYNFELVRYCTKTNLKIIGGAEKIFNYFIKEYNPVNIISYCDLSKFNGEVYDKLGFVAKSEVHPSCHWYNAKKHQHITDNLLRQRGFDQLFGTNYGKGSSNEELMVKNGFVKIYDCGQQTFCFR